MFDRFFLKLFVIFGPPFLSFFFFVNLQTLLVFSFHLWCFRGDLLICIILPNTHMKHETTRLFFVFFCLVLYIYIKVLGWIICPSSSSIMKQWSIKFIYYICISMLCIVDWFISLSLNKEFKFFFFFSGWDFLFLVSGVGRVRLKSFIDLFINLLNITNGLLIKGKT